jgi:hypothetical protein
MISFTIKEIILSVIHSNLFGFFLAYIYEFCRVILFLPDTISMVFKKSSLSDVLSIYNIDRSIAVKLLFFFLYTTGTILLSYYTLDGMVRGYVVVLSLTAFLLARKAAFYSLQWVVYWLFTIVLYPFSKFWRKNRL